MLKENFCQLKRTRFRFEIFMGGHVSVMQVTYVFVKQELKTCLDFIACNDLQSQSFTDKDYDRMASKELLEAERDDLTREVEHLKNIFRTSNGRRHIAIGRRLVNRMNRLVAVEAELTAIETIEVANLEMAWQMIQNNDLDGRRG
jgi:hypothetical protein